MSEAGHVGDAISFVFGKFQLDVAGRKLWLGEHLVELNWRALEALVMLVRHRDRVVTKEELIKTIWRDSFVSDDSLTQCIWSLRRATYWPQQHNDVIQKILRKARKGARVVYIPGNHDELVTSFCGTYGNIEIKENAIHVTRSGERILIIHGHELDVVVSGSGRMKWLAFAGDVSYQFLLSLNPLINFVRRRFGLGFWSLSAYAKRRVKDAVSFIGKFEAAVAHYAERYHVDAVLCGHIHSAAIREFGRIAYYNCGDWVESCTALVEGNDGMIALVNYHSLSSSGRTVPPTIASALAKQSWVPSD